MSPVTPCQAVKFARKSINATRTPDDTVHHDIAVSNVNAEVTAPCVTSREEICEKVESIVVIGYHDVTGNCANRDEAKSAGAKRDVENEKPIVREVKKKRFSTLRTARSVFFQADFRIHREAVSWPRLQGQLVVKSHVRCAPVSICICAHCKPVPRNGVS